MWGAVRAGKLFAVGTPVARRPPHRSRRAQLTHRAPTLGERGNGNPLARTCTGSWDTLTRL